MHKFVIIFIIGVMLITFSEGIAIKQTLSKKHAPVTIDQLYKENVHGPHSNALDGRPFQPFSIQTETHQTREPDPVEESETNHGIGSDEIYFWLVFGAFLLTVFIVIFAPSR